MCKVHPPVRPLLFRKTLISERSNYIFNVYTILTQFSCKAQFIRQVPARVVVDQFATSSSSCNLHNALTCACCDGRIIRAHAICMLRLRCACLCSVGYALVHVVKVVSEQHANINYIYLRMDFNMFGRAIESILDSTWEPRYGNRGIKFSERKPDVLTQLCLYESQQCLIQ